MLDFKTTWFLREGEFKKRSYAVVVVFEGLGAKVGDKCWGIFAK